MTPSADLKLSLINPGLFAQFRELIDQAPPGSDLLGVGLDLSASTLLTAYAAGVFPMGVGRHGRPPIGWWSPEHRGILTPSSLHVSRSLRRSMRAFDYSFNTCFDDVVAGCSDPSRDGRWITAEIAAAYSELHRLGHAHSMEVWLAGDLVGGLYGVQVGRLFAGESMFHRATDASKAALVLLVRGWLAQFGPQTLIDVQWRTDHLGTLGVTEVPRVRYLQLLDQHTGIG